jgi:amino acid transporter/beta-glucanase (GH16 family)
VKTEDGLKRVIGFWGGLAVIVGVTIGSGVFRKPYTLARDVGDPPTIIGLWVVFGLITLCGALALAELASMLPRTGGLYVYLRAAYGDGAAFVFGWLYLLVTTPATNGALSTFFGELILGMAGIEFGASAPWRVPAVASVTVLVLTGVNLLGARLGSAVQTVFTLIKVAALLVLMLVSFTSPGGSFSHMAPSVAGASALGVGAASVIWAYDGWTSVSMVAGEVVAPERLMRRIIVAGMLTIVFLYVGANIGYFYAMPVGEMAQNPVVPQRIMSERIGPLGATLISMAILCSVFGALNGNILSRPRVPYALARDGLTFPFLGRPHPRWATPYISILIQSAATVVLVALLRDFDRLTTYFVVVEWSALLFAVGAVMVLRRRLPDAPRPFRTPLYPLVPIVFLVGTLAGLVAIVRGEIGRPVPNYSPLWGLLIAAAGFPVYRLWRRATVPMVAILVVASALLGPGCGVSRPASGPPSPPSPSTGSRTLVWSDEFDGPSGALVDAGRWVSETGGHGWGNNELQFYTDRGRNAFLDGDGFLVIQADRERVVRSRGMNPRSLIELGGAERSTPQTPPEYTSARLKTQGRFEQAYGRFEARLQVPRGQGIWPAFWMLGNDIPTVGWPRCGEIDVMENIGREPSTVHGSMHGPGFSGGQSLTAAYTLPGGAAFADAFHVFAVEWEPAVVRFFVDGNLYSTHTLADLRTGQTWVFDHPFFILLNVAVGGDWPGRPDATTVFPQTMRVDYVRVYR